ncbi:MULTISPECIES: hypothetical protein [Nocardiaceae]|uniref:hypothetical protein n=1 Tax=Nocardiaceae TaxID=85025 RepID=UPI000ABFCADA|nr:MULTISPECIES: hypothetical protein [Rhodococcus]
MSGWSFTFEPHVGVVFRDDGRGCPVAYFGSETYDRAHTEAGPVALDRIHSTKVWVPATADDRTLSFTQRQARARWWHLLGHAAGQDVR